MARRYVPNTYNNGRFLRLIIGAVITIILSVVILFLILFFIFQGYVDSETGELIIPGLLDNASPTPDVNPESGNDNQDGGDADDGSGGDDTNAEGSN